MINNPSKIKDCTHTEQYKHLFTTPWQEKIFEIRKCLQCGLIYHFPFTTIDELDELYDNYGYADPEYVKREYRENTRYYEKLMKRLFPFIPGKDAKILDVGCANGNLLKYFVEQGYSNCYGVEVDSHSIAYARKLLGDDRVFNGFLSDSPFLTGDFDLVLNEQTIEHVPDPFKIMTDMNSCLKPLGILYISTPNFGGFSFNILKGEWKNTAPNNHISMFDVETLQAYLKEAEFSIVSKRVRGENYNQRRSSSGIAYDRFSSGLIKFSLAVFGYLLHFFEKADNLSFICRKNK